MFNNNEEYIVRNSKDIFCKFHMENKNLILEEFKDDDIIKKYILEHDVLEYSMDIDENDIMHIIYINLKGELNYIVYPEGKEKENILILTGDCVIKALKIKIMYSNVHIFYMVNDINNNYLCHKYNHNNRWYHEKISYADYSKYNYPYFMDCCNENIYILYCENHNESRYKIKRLNTIDNSWKDIEENLILKHSSNFNFFVTPGNLGIICFNKSINNNIQTLLKYKDFKNTHSTWSKDINISAKGVNTAKPKIFNMDDYIYIMWKQGNHVVYKKSKDILEWGEGYELNVNTDSIYNVFYRSNNFDDFNLKVDHMYVSYRTFLYPIIQFKIKNLFEYEDRPIKNHFDNFNLNEASITLKDRCKININSGNNEKNECIKDLIDKIESRNKNFSYLNKINLDLSNHINILNNLINEYEVKLNNIKDRNIEEKNNLNTKLEKQVEIYKNSIDEYEENLHKLKIEKILENQIYMKDSNNYENEIRQLNEEREKLLRDSNGKVFSLLTLIEKKEEIIQGLRSTRESVE